MGQAELTDLVGTFLGQAGTAGVQHVTYLSAYGMDAAPPEVGPRAVELELLSRNDFTHSIVRPAWFMQNFSEGHLARRTAPHSVGAHQHSPQLLVANQSQGAASE